MQSRRRSAWSAHGILCPSAHKRTRGTRPSMKPRCGPSLAHSLILSLSHSLSLSPPRHRACVRVWCMQSLPCVHVAGTELCGCVQVGALCEMLASFGARPHAAGSQTPAVRKPAAQCLVRLICMHAGCGGTDVRAWRVEVQDLLPPQDRQVTGNKKCDVQLALVLSGSGVKPQAEAANGLCSLHQG